MTGNKRIKYGKIKTLASYFRCHRNTVASAIRGGHDTELCKRIREKAAKFGYYK